MILTFLGTRGYIDACTPQHRMHSALLVAHRGKRVMVDCGEDWLGKLGGMRLHAIVITHAHPDHAWGLKHGSPCPIYATGPAWGAMTRFPIRSDQRRFICPWSRTHIAGLTVEAIPVEHSLRAPAVGYRIRTGRGWLFYVPDVIGIPRAEAALRHVQLYIGDGASVVRPIVRRRDHVRIGHASIREQLAWCDRADVRRAIFTHCGTQIVAGPAAQPARVAAMGREYDIDAQIAYDGMKLRIL